LHRPDAAPAIVAIRGTLPTPDALLMRETMQVQTGGYPMNKDHVEGKSKQFKGSVKDTAGKVTGDDKMRAEGKADKAEGKVQGTFADAKDSVKGAYDAAKDKMSKK
jgi:uncharacterized protein YjbJ (UPF0337 family)